jgi:hypothetical protein
MKNKLLAVIVLLTFVVNSVLPVAFSAPLVDMDNNRVIVSAKIKGFNTALDNSYRGQYGLLYNLYYVSLLLRWTDFAYSVSELQIGEVEKEFYRTNLISKIKNFNNRFEKEIPESDQFYYQRLKLPYYENKPEFKTMMKEFLGTDTNSDTGQLVDYLRTAMDALVAKLGTDTQSAEYAKTLQVHKEEIRYMYRIIEVLQNENIEMKSMLGIGTNDDASSLSTLSNSVSAALIINDTKYTGLIQVGRSWSKDEASGTFDVGVNSKGKTLEKLAHVTEKSNPQEGEIGADRWVRESGFGDQDGKFRLQDTYIAMIAATALYKPFSSHVGDKDYLNALAGLTGSNYKAVEALYNEIKDYKKPLYAVEDAGWWKNRIAGASKTTSVAENYSGKVRMLSVGDFLERISNEGVTGLVVVKGKFTTGEDANSYVYFQDSSAALLERTQAAQKPAATPATPTTTTPAPATTTPPATPPTTESAVKKGLIVSADKEITTGQLSSSVFEFGYEHGYPITGLALLRNYKNKAKEADSITNKNSRYLYLNPIGDIVLDDNTVIVPAAANPMLYDETLGYNPYTVAFMNAYPTVAVSQKGDLRITAPQDPGKYLYMAESDELGAKSVFIQIQGETSLAVTHSKKPIAIYSDFFNTNGKTEKIFSKTNGSIPGFFSNLLVGALATVGVTPLTGGLGAVKVDDQFSVGNTPLFPYYSEMDDTGAIGKIVARNLYKSYKTDGSQAIGNTNGRLKEDFIFRNILLEGLNGSLYASVYSKNMTQDYEAMVNQGFGRFKVMVRDWAKEVLSSFGKVDGVLGMKNRYQDPILGKFLLVVDDYFWYIMFFLFLVFIIKFMRDRMSLVYTVLMSAVAICVVFGFVRIIPVYMPGLYNLVVNNSSKDLSYQILATKAEKYFQTYGKGGQIDEKGKFVISTTSLNLFKLTDRQMKNLEEKYKINTRDLISGKSYIVDGQNGVYLEGDTLKVNVDMLMSTNPITGSYVDIMGEKVYQMKSEKIYPSVIDYYIPYYQIIDGFTKTLNDLLRVYHIPRATSTYAKGFEKDSYMVFSYINSAPFLVEGPFSQQSGDIRPEEVEKLSATFTESGRIDFLNLTTLLSNSTTEMKETLWYQTLQQNGYLDDTDLSIKKRNDLVDAVNYQTKKFLIDIKPQVGLISDENLIKMVGLQAVTILNQKASEYGNWMSPISLNYQEYKMEDVLLAAFTNDYSRFVSQNMDVVNYIADNSNIMVLLIFIGDLCLAFLITMIIQFAIPILYLMFGLMLIVRFMAGSRLKAATTGYLKISGLIYACFSLFVMTLGWVSGIKVEYAVIGIGIVYLLIVIVLFQVLTSVIFNFSEMGNSKINEKFDGLLKNTRLDNVANNLKVNTTNILRSAPEFINAVTGREYRHDRDMDDLSEESTYSARAFRNADNRRRTSAPKQTEKYIREENRKLREEVNSGNRKSNYGDIEDLDDYRTS